MAIFCKMKGFRAENRAENSNCNNCNEQIETIKHKFLDCSKVVQTWEKIDELLDSLELTPPSRSLNGKVGIGEVNLLIRLTIYAEILARLNSTAGKRYDVNSIIKTSLHTLLNCKNFPTVIASKIKEYEANLYKRGKRKK